MQVNSFSGYNPRRRINRDINWSYITDRPGTDTFDIAGALGLGLWEATELVSEMLVEGLLTYRG